MIDKGRLNDKQVAFRIVGSDLVHIGVVKSVEGDGFWIESPQLIGQMQADRGWGDSPGANRDPRFLCANFEPDVSDCKAAGLRIPTALCQVGPWGIRDLFCGRYWAFLLRFPPEVSIPAESLTCAPGNRHH